MISLTSRLAVLFASLIVAASANVFAVDRSVSQQRLKIVRDKPGAEEKQLWASAISNDNIELLRQLYRRFEPADLVFITAKNGKTALMVASKKGDLVFAKRLVTSGARVHDTTITQGTALMFAVLGDQLRMLEWLVSKGANVNAKGSNGWTALTIAAAKGNVRLLNWLIQHGAETEIRDVYRYTPLLRAADNGFSEIVKILLKLPNADVNAADEYLNTALHHAVSAGDIEIIEILLSNGANKNLANRNGLTPLDLAGENETLMSILNGSLRYLDR